MKLYIVFIIAFMVIGCAGINSAFNEPAGWTAEDYGGAVSMVNMQVNQEYDRFNKRNVFNELGEGPCLYMAKEKQRRLAELGIESKILVLDDPRSRNDHAVVIVGDTALDNGYISAAPFPAKELTRLFTIKGEYQ